MPKTARKVPLLLFIALVALVALVAVTAGIPSVASAQAGGAPGGPSVTMSLLSTTAQVRTGSPLPVKAAFSEPVSGFTVDDIAVVNGAAGNFTGSGGGAVYTFDVTPDSIGTVTVEIAAGAAEDAAGGGNEAAPLLSLGIPYDDDGDGEISRNEAIAAITDYFADRLARDEVLGVITLYFASVGPAAPVSMTLAAGAGDSVEHGSGAQIEIPPDTTAEAATVAIAEVDPPESPVAVGRVFDFSVVDVDGQDVELQQPVTITLPYHLPKGKTAADIVVLDWNHEAGVWEAVDGQVVDEASGTVSVEVSDLSHKAVAWLLTLPEFLASAVDQVVEGTLGEHYRRDPETGGLGFKHLVAFKISGSTPKFNAGAALVLDIDDLARVTDEGEANYVTFWINGTIGAGGLSLTQSMPVGMSIFQHKREVNLDDPSFNPSFAAFTVDSPLVQISALTIKDGKISPLGSQNVASACPSCLNVSWADLSFNAVRAEMKVLPYLDILDGLLESYGHDDTVSVPADEFAAELVRNWFVKDGIHIKTVVANSTVPFTSYDSPSPDVLETLDLDYYNQFRDVDEGVWGGIDLNGDGRGDMVFPSEVDQDRIVLNSTLHMQLRTDPRQERKYYVELEDLTPGWKIESEHLNPFLRKFFIFRATPNSTVTAEWKVGNDALAPDEALATFSLAQDNSEFGLLDKVVDRITIRLWKTRAVSDLTVRASGSPGSVAPGETVTYTVSVTNGGADRAEAVALTVGGLNQAGLALRSVRADGLSQQCDAFISGDALTCSLGGMDDGETITVTLEFEVVFEPPEAVTATLAFHAASQVYDPAPDNNSAEVTTTVQPAAAAPGAPRDS